MIKQGLKIFTALFFFSTILGIGEVAGQDTGSSDLEDLKQKVESYKPGNTTFLMRGYAHAGFEIVDNKSSFVSGTFAPIFLWRQSDRILFEAEAEIAYSDAGTSFALEYANLSYILSDYFVVRFGNFLTPFGIFGERLHPNWINRFPTNPLGFNHHNPVGPFGEFGVELRGGAPLGNGRVNYAAYISNGPQLMVDTSVSPVSVNTSYQSIFDNNENKAIGGRVGFLPFSNSSLEVGFSGQYAKIGDRDTGFEEISSLMYSADLTFVKTSITAIKGGIDLKGQWNYVDEDRFQLVDALGNVTDIVDNDLSAYFVMFSYRPSQSGNNFINKLELVARYSAFNIIHDDLFISGDGHNDHTHGASKILPPSPGTAVSGSAENIASSIAGPGDPHGTLDEDKSQWAFGLNYWLTWRSVLKMSYQVTENSNEIPGFFVHYALGF